MIPIPASNTLGWSDTIRWAIYVIMVGSGCLLMLWAILPPRRP